MSNIFGELGWNAESDHNRANLIKKIAVCVCVGVFALLRGGRVDSYQENDY